MNNKREPLEAGLISKIFSGNEGEGSKSKCKKCGFNISPRLPRNNESDLSSEEQKIDPAVDDVVSNLLQIPLTSRPELEQCHIILCVGRPLKLAELNKEVETWCSECKWLCSSSNLQKLFCWPCVVISSKGNVWCASSLDDFPTITESVNAHEESKDHIENLLRFLELKSDLKECSEYKAISDDEEQNASSAKIAKYDEDVMQNRRLMQLIIDTVLWAVEQETMYSRKVLKCLLELVVTLGSEDIVDRFEQFKRLFPGDMTTVQDELVEYINEYIEEYVKNELEATDMFAVRLDSVNGHPIIVRFVNTNGQLVERLLGFYNSNLPGTWGIYRSLETALEPFNYKNKLVAQCYDSGNICGAHLDEIKRKIKEDAPQAVFVYCVEHRLSLILEQNFEINFDSFFLSKFRVIYNLTFFLQRYRPEWPSEAKNMFKVVADEWDSLYNCLDNRTRDRYEYDISSFQEAMQEFHFTFLTCILAEIFEVINLLYDVLKQESLNVDACLEQIQNTCQTIGGMKGEENFQRLLESAKVKSNTDELNDQEFNKYKRMYCNILDSFLLELHVRFEDMAKLKFVALTDSSKFEEYSVNFPSHLLPSLQEGFPKIFPRMERLKHELEVFYSKVIYYNETIESVIGNLQIHNIYKDVFTEVYKLFCLVATLPSTYVENTSSFLQEVKTCAKYPTLEDDDKNKYSTQHIGLQLKLMQELTDDEKETFYNKIIDKFAAIRKDVIDLV